MLKKMQISLLLLNSFICFVILREQFGANGSSAPSLERYALELFLKESPAQHSYIILDKFSDYVDSEVKSIMVHQGNSIFVYSIDVLRTFLTSYYHGKGFSNVLLFCSQNTTLEIFRQVANENMESNRLMWYVFHRQNFPEQMLNLLREGTNIISMSSEGGRDFNFVSTRVNRNNSLRFDVIASGYWTNTTQHLYICDPPLIKNLDLLYSNLKGRTLTVTANDDWPFFTSKRLPNGTFQPVSGLDFDIVTAISEKHGFSYVLFPPLDGLWGGPRDDGTVSGLIGAVSRREAHLAIDEITITELRESVVDFTYPYYTDYTTIVTNSPRRLSKALAILMPYTYDVWSYIVIAVLGIGPVLYLVHRFELGVGNKNWKYNETTFNTFRTLVIQGSRLRSHHIASRIVLTTWMLFCLVVDILYASLLTSILVVPSYEKPIDTLNGAIRAGKQGIPVATVAQTSIENVFKGAKSGIFKEVWEIMNVGEFTATIEEGFQKILKEKYVYIISGISVDIFPIALGQQHFHRGTDAFSPQHYGIACPAGAPYIGAFSKTLQLLNEAGFITKWKKDSFASAKGHFKGKNSAISANNSDPSERSEALSLQHLQGAFFLMTLGFSLAAVMLVVEIKISKRLSGTELTNN